MPTSSAPKASDDAAFDFRGISWLGRDRDISTSVSPRSFAAAAQRAAVGRRRRNISGSARTRRRRLQRRRWSPLPPTATACFRCRRGRTRSPRRSSRSRARSSSLMIRVECRSSPAMPSPIPALESRTDLDQYRIIHFATHGVVTSRAAKCAAQPALLTSFGGKRLGRAADLQGGIRPASRRRPRHPFGLRHRGQGEHCGDPAGRSCDRRRRCARRSGARVRRRRRAAGHRQPLAGAGRL